MKQDGQSVLCSQAKLSFDLIPGWATGMGERGRRGWNGGIREGVALEHSSTAELYFLSHGVQILFPNFNHLLVMGHTWGLGTGLEYLPR